MLLQNVLCGAVSVPVRWERHPVSSSREAVRFLHEGWRTREVLEGKVRSSPSFQAAASRDGCPAPRQPSKNRRAGCKLQ